MRADPAIFLLAVAQTIIWAGIYYSFPALLVRWEADLGWSRTELTAVFTAAVAVSALASPVAGRLIDRGHGPRLIAGSILAGGLLIGALSLVESYAAFLAVWLLLGLAMAGGLYEPCFALVTRARGAASKRPITLITLVAGFAGTLSFPTAHAVSEAVGWRGATLTFAVLICCIAAPLAWQGARRLEDSRAAESVSHGRGGFAGSHAFLRRPAFWLLAIAFAITAVNHGVVLNHLLPLLAERGVAADTAVFAAAMIGPMQVFGRLLMMVLEQYVSNALATSYCFLGMALAAALLQGAAGTPVLLVGFVILQGSAYGLTSIMKPVVSRELLGGANFGAITGAMAVPYLAAFAFAPSIGSLLWETGGYGFAINCVVVMALAGFLLFLTALLRGRRGG